MNKKPYLIGLGVALAVLGIWWMASSGPGDKARQEEAVESPLFTGEEATAKVKLFFVDIAKAGFASEISEIYLSDSKTAQVKQVLKKLFAGPAQPAHAAAWTPDSAALEVFLDGAGLCVVDLNTAAAASHPGGTTAEYQSLYTLYRTLKEHFSEIKRVQVLVDGQRVPSLAGHLNLMDPITQGYF